MAETWLLVFSFWYLITTVYTIRKFCHSSLTLGVLSIWAFASDSWMHASVYVYGDPNGYEIPLHKNLFLIPFTVVIISLYFKFIILTYATNLTKVLLAVFFLVGVFYLLPPDDAVKDFSWHCNHAVLHLITAMFAGVCAEYFEELRMIKQKTL